jgi:hypothetical protein
VVHRISIIHALSDGTASAYAFSYKIKWLAPDSIIVIHTYIHACMITLSSIYSMHSDH